ncbi:helix-turn-helix domain-containing protein [Janibacter alkaliphilus]
MVGGVRSEPRSGCPINIAVEVLGDPWSLVVLRDIMFGDRRYFRELLTRSEEGIASNVLAARLKGLVAAGLLTRDEARRGQRVRYSLTEVGIQTLPVLVALGTWGRAHRDTDPLLTVRQTALEEGGPAMVDELMDELRAGHLGAALPAADGPRASERLQAAYAAAAGSPVSTPGP